MKSNFDNYGKNKLKRDRSYENYNNVFKNTGKNSLNNNRGHSALSRNINNPNNNCEDKEYLDSNNYSIHSIKSSKRLQTIENELNCFKSNKISENGDFIEENEKTNNVNKSSDFSVIPNSSLLDIANDIIKKLPNDSIVLNNNCNSQTNENYLFEQYGLDFNNLKLCNLEFYLSQKKRQMPEQYNDNYINFIRNYFFLTLTENKKTRNNEMNTNNNVKNKNSFRNPTNKNYNYNNNFNYNNYNNINLFNQNHQNHKNIINGQYKRIVINDKYLSSSNNNIFSNNGGENNNIFNYPN